MGLLGLSFFTLCWTIMAGVLDESEIPADFLAKIKSDLSHTLQALGKEATRETRKFHRICCDPLVYVHVYHKDELTPNSGVSVLAWDEMSTITNENRLLQQPPLPVRSLDFRPFLYDNHGLKKMGVTNKEFLDAYDGTTASIDCQEYTYELSHSCLAWEERVWSSRLFWILKKQEKDLAIKVFNVSDKGIQWENVLQDLLHSSKPAVCATPFKGVTDIFVVGKVSTVTVLVRDEIDVSKFSCGQGVRCNSIVIEVGIGAPVRVDCPNYQGKLPNKLGELLSSMYLFGVASALSECPSPLVQIKTYGWLLVRGLVGMGVELLVSRQKPSVKILFIDSTSPVEQFGFLYGKIQGSE